MIEPEEIEGFVDALGAVTYEEIVNAVKELAYVRNEEEPLEEGIADICKKAVSEHLIELISPEELIENNECEEIEWKGEPDLYILGPHAFPDYPFELSEIIDVLKLNKREVDPEKLTKRYSRRLKARVTKLRHNIEKCAKGEEDAIDIATLEHQYSDLLNIYYDYDSWLEDSIAEMEDEILSLSKQIDLIGSAQDI